MIKAKVLRNGELLGYLSKEDSEGYSFEYTDAWFNDPAKPAVSLTLPKTQKE